MRNGPNQVTERAQTDRRVLVVVPAYNEAGRIGRALADLAEHAPWADVVVIDDGSADATAAEAAAGGAAVVRLPFNLGVGGAMQTGYLYAAECGYDAAVQFDGDGQHRADQIPALLAAMDEGGDLIIGSRLLGDAEYQFPLLRWIGSRLLAAVVSLTSGVRITDPTSGFRAASRRLIRFFARHYPQTYLGDTVEAVAIAARHGMSVRETPARIRPADHSSIGSVTGFIHTLRICVAVLIDRMERPLTPADLQGPAGPTDEKETAS